MEAVGLNAVPKIMPTRDLFEHDEGAHIPGTNKRQRYSSLVSSGEIARCLVGEWTGTTVHGVGMNPNCHPGIWVIRDRMPVIQTAKKTVDGELMTYEEKMVVDAAGNQQFRPANPEEKQEMWEEDLAHARQCDRTYAEWCWNEGNRIYQAWQHGSKEPVPREMPPVYKLAARHYGLDAEWLKEAASSNARPCPTCEKIVSKTAIVCQFCMEPIDIERWAAWKAEKDAALNAAVRNLKGRSSLPPPVSLPSPQVTA